MGIKKIWVRSPLFCIIFRHHLTASEAAVDFVKTPQVGATGLIYCKYNEDGTSKSTVDKFFDEKVRNAWAEKAACEKGDLLLIMAGEVDKTRKALGTLRLHLAEELGYRNPEVFAPLWVLDFPLLEWDEETKRYHGSIVIE